MVPRAIYTGNRMKLTGISDATINKYVLKKYSYFYCLVHGHCPFCHPKACLSTCVYSNNWMYPIKNDIHFM